MILALADHSQFRDPSCGKSLRKWDCLYFSNHIQQGILPTVENAVRLSGLISSRIKKCVFSKITAVFSSLWDHPNPTEHLDLGMELNDWIWFQAQVTNCHPRRTAELDTELNFHHLVALGQKSSGSLHVSPPETTRGEAHRFQNQEHPGTSSSWAIYLHSIKTFPKQRKCAWSKKLTFQKVNKGLTEIIFIARNSKRKENLFMDFCL